MHMKTGNPITDIARAFAFGAHQAIDQKRHYTGECYTVHLTGVVNHLERVGIYDPMVHAVAYLHDVIEDTDVTLKQVKYLFGPVIARDVEAMTDSTLEVPELKNRPRSVKKAIYIEQIAKAGPEVHLVKLADVLHNLESVVQHDTKFATTMLKEASWLIRAVKPSDNETYRDAKLALIEGIEAMNGKLITVTTEGVYKRTALIRKMVSGIVTGTCKLKASKGVAVYTVPCTERGREIADYNASLLGSIFDPAFRFTLQSDGSIVSYGEIITPTQQMASHFKWAFK